MSGRKKTVRYASLIAIFVIFSTSILNYAAAQTEPLQSTTVTGDNLKNDPMVAKILTEIEYSKKQIAQLQQDQKNAETNTQLIEQQRAIAAQLEQQALQILQTETMMNSSQNSFSRFVNTVNNTKVQNVFWGEFNFMTQRVDAGHAVMKKVLDNGGTWEEAMQAFSQYAGIKRTEMISINENLNIQNGLADPKVQADFNQYGMLPDDYIKKPT